MRAEGGKRAATIGNFDGVHLGHRLVLDSLRGLAEEKGMKPLVVTFSSHPLQIVCPERAPGLLMLPEEKKGVLEELGFEVLMLDFDERLRMLSSEGFMKFLRDECNVHALLLGHDNRFGHDRASTLEDYTAEGKQLGIEVAVAPVLPGISSSAIRKCIEAGDVREAAGMLGSPYRLEGEVEHGKMLGRQIGFPTANLRCDSRLALPARGVYAAVAETEEGKAFRSMVNIGCRPTVCDRGEPTVEAYLDGYSGDLYGKRVRLGFTRRLREERRFSSLDELKRQLAADLEAIRR